jgi:hypothetical protein
MYPLSDTKKGRSLLSGPHFFAGSLQRMVCPTGQVPRPTIKARSPLSKIIHRFALVTFTLRPFMYLFHSVFCHVATIIQEAPAFVKGRNEMDLDKNFVVNIEIFGYCGETYQKWR